MSILITIILLVGLFVIAFIVIARKGRELRKNQPLPPSANQAFLEAADGKKYSIHPGTPFYVGNDSSSDVVVSKATQPYEMCIFYHRKRFAFQTPSGIPGIRVNGEEQLAGYLFDRDVVTVAGEDFVFRTGAGKMPAIHNAGEDACGP
jgi:hypothetical protein